MSDVPKMPWEREWNGICFNTLSFSVNKNQFEIILRCCDRLYHWTTFIWRKKSWSSWWTLFSAKVLQTDVTPSSERKFNVFQVHWKALFHLQTRYLVNGKCWQTMSKSIVDIYKNHKKPDQSMKTSRSVTSIKLRSIFFSIFFWLVLLVAITITLLLKLKT